MILIVLESRTSAAATTRHCELLEGLTGRLVLCWLWIDIVVVSYHGEELIVVLYFLLTFLAYGPRTNILVLDLRSAATTTLDDVANPQCTFPDEILEDLLTRAWLSPNWSSPKET